MVLISRFKASEEEGRIAKYLSRPRGHGSTLLTMILSQVEGSFIKMRIHISRNIQGSALRFMPAAGQRQKQAGRLSLFGDLRRGFQLRDQLVADRNVKDL